MDLRQHCGPLRTGAGGAAGLVLEIPFDSLRRSKRRKSGLAMRFPRNHCIRLDKAAAEADRVDSLTALIAD